MEGDKPFDGVFVTPPRVLRRERIEYRRPGLFQFRDGQDRRKTDRFGLVFGGHRKRLLLAASTVLCSRDIAAE